MWSSVGITFAGAFAEQYSAHPELLSIVFPVILLHGLNYSETALFATRALKDICRENRTSLSPFSDGILSVCHQILLQDRMAVSTMWWECYSDTMTWEVVTRWFFFSNVWVHVRFHTAQKSALIIPFYGLFVCFLDKKCSQTFVMRRPCSFYSTLWWYMQLAG